MVDDWWQIVRGSALDSLLYYRFDIVEAKSKVSAKKENGFDAKCSIERSICCPVRRTLKSISKFRLHNRAHTQKAKFAPVDFGTFFMDRRSDPTKGDERRANQLIATSECSAIRPLLNGKREPVEKRTTFKNANHFRICIEADVICVFGFKINECERMWSISV